MGWRRAYVSVWLRYGGRFVLLLGVLLLLIRLVMYMAEIGWIVALAGLLAILVGEVLRRI